MKKATIYLLTLSLLCSCSENSNEEKPAEIEESVTINTQEVGETLVEENWEGVEEISVFEAKCLSEKEALELINSKFTETLTVTYDYSMHDGKIEAVGNEAVEIDSDEKHPMYRTYVKIEDRDFMVTIVSDQIFAEELLKNSSGDFIGKSDILTENNYILIFDERNANFLKINFEGQETEIFNGEELKIRQIDFIDEQSLKRN